MEPTRRFDEREIALIFEHAGRLQDVGRPAADADGLSYAQLQEIAHEVGIAPEHLERAATAVAAGELLPTRRRTWLGLPVGVSRTVEFQRRLTDEEWTHLVVTLRETFDARGRLEADGPFRQWSNGNLQALLEPTDGGHRLRLTTRKGDARMRVLMGSGYLALAAFVTGLGAIGAISDKAALAGPLLLGAVGVLSLASAVLGLPRWAALRSRQMEAIAAEASSFVSRPTRLAPGAASPSSGVPID